MRRVTFSLLCIALLATCSFDAIRLNLAPGWSSQSISAWRNTHPQALASSNDDHWLYVSFDTETSISTPSLAGINMNSGRSLILISGLNHAHAMQIAPDKSLWIGERFNEGLIWRIAEPDKLPEDQRIDRGSLSISHPAIAPLPAAGQFNHTGFAFSADGRFAYLVSGGEKQGYIFRFAPISRQLEVYHDEKGWLLITTPESAESEAQRLGGHRFTPLAGMTRLPDGSILIAEPERGHLLQLVDGGEGPVLSVYPASTSGNAELNHPEEVLWDADRQWLWIADNATTSRLWAWDGKHLTRIASHNSSHITGIVLRDKTLYLNLRDNRAGPEITLKLNEKSDPRL